MRVSLPREGMAFFPGTSARTFRTMDRYCLVFRFYTPLDDRGCPGLARSSLAAQEERLRFAFDRLDTDESGYITKSNLREVMGHGYDEEAIEVALEVGDPVLSSTKPFS